MNRAMATIFGALTLAVLASQACAGLRVPQVVVSGGTLQSYLDAQGETINVASDQEDMQRWMSPSAFNNTYTFQIELSGNAASNTIGFYNAGADTPPLYPVFPGTATTGWFAVASWRPSPTRLVISLFDNNASFLGRTTYLEGPPDRGDFGYYLQGACGTLYTQDARNPGSLAQALTFQGRGINSGSWWLAWEDSSAPCGSDRDFDDCVLFISNLNGSPVAKATWGALKARFH